MLKRLPTRRRPVVAPVAVVRKLTGAEALQRLRDYDPSTYLVIEDGGRFRGDKYSLVKVLRAWQELKSLAMLLASGNYYSLDGSSGAISWVSRPRMKSEARYAALAAVTIRHASPFNARSFLFK